MRRFSPYDKPKGDIISYVSPFLFVAILFNGKRIKDIVANLDDEEVFY